MSSPYTTDTFTEDQIDFLTFQRDSSPAYKHLSNRVLYESLREKGLIPENLLNKSIDSRIGFKTKTDPDELEKMVGLAKFVDSFGDFVEDYETLEAAYERSLTGQTRRMLFGESKFFDIENPEDANAPELNPMQDVLASAVSFSMPLDAITMSFGIRTGSLVSRGRFFKGKGGYNKNVSNLERFFREKVNKGLDKKGYRGLSMPQNVALGMVEGSFPLAFYEGAMGYVGAKINNQNPENKQLDVASEVAKGVIHGGVLGALTSGLTTGVMSRKAMTIQNKGKRSLSKEELKTLPFNERFAWKAGTAPGTIALESLAFTGVETLEKIYNGEDVRLFGEHGVLTSFAKNAALFSTLKAKKMAIGNTWASMKSITPDWIRTWANKKVKDSNEAVEREMSEKHESEINDAFNEIKSNFQKQKDTFNRKNESYIEIKNQVEKDLKYIQESFAKGEKHYSKDAKALALQQTMAERIHSVKDFLKSLQGTIPEAQEPFLAQKIKEIEGHQKRYEELRDIQNEKFDKWIEGEGQERDTLLRWLKANDVKAVVHGGAERNIFDPIVPTKVLKEAKTFKEESLERKAGVVSKIVTADKLDKKLKLIPAEVFRQGKEIIDGKLKPVSEQAEPGERQTLLTKHLTSVQGAPKEVKKANLGKFNESGKIIDYVIQKELVWDMPKVSAERLKISNAVNQISHLREFATFLSEKNKSFLDMTPGDIRRYGQLKGKQGHRGTIHRLVDALDMLGLGTREARKLAGKKGDAKLRSYFKVPIPGKEAEKARALSREWFVEKDGKFRVQRPTGKRGVKKEMPTTKVLENLYKSQTKNVKGDAVFRENTYTETTNKSGNVVKKKSKIPLTGDKINAFIEQVTGRKLAKGDSPARALSRQALMSFVVGLPPIRYKLTTGKDKGQTIEISITEFVKQFGLGDKSDAITQAYGKKNIKRAESIYKNKALIPFMKLVDNYVAGKVNKKSLKELYGGKDPSSYSIIEVLDAYKKVSEGPAKQVYNYGEPSKVKKIQKTFELDKNMAKLMLRYMLEVPSRLNEMLPPGGTKRSLEAQLAQERIEFSSKEIEMIESNIAPEMKSKGKSELEIAMEANERAKRLFEIAKEKKSFTKTGRYKKRVGINVRAKKIEAEIKKLRGKTISEEIIKDAKLSVLGIENLTTKTKKGKSYLSYEIGKEKGIDSGKLELYKDHLQKVVDHIKNPTGIEKKLQQKGFDGKKIKEIARAAGVKNGDITKLNSKAIEVIDRAIKDMDIFRFPEPDESPYTDPNEKSGTLVKFINTIKDGTRRNYLAAATKLNELAFKSRKGSESKKYEFLNEIAQGLDYFKTSLKGEGTNIYKKYITKILPKEKRKDMYWHNKKWMKEIIDVVEGGKKVKDSNPKVLAEYKRLYDLNIESYINAYGKDGKKGKPGTPEYESAQGLRNYLDKRWTEFVEDILYAHRELKTSNPAEYKKLEAFLESQKEKDYMPQYAAEIVKKDLNHKNLSIKEIEESVVKRIDKNLKKQAEKLTDKNFKGISKMSLGQKVREKRGYEDKLNSNIEKIRKNKMEMAKLRDKAIKEIENTHTFYELTVDRTFPELKERKNTLPLVMEKDGKVVRTYKDNAYEIFGTYFLSSSQFMGIAKVAPEFLKGYWKNPSAKPVESAIREIRAFSKGRNKNKDIDYVEQIINELAGAVGSKQHMAAKNLAYVVSSAGLSAVAEPGFKNFMLGQVMTLATHGTRDYTKALWRLASWDKWNKATENAVKAGAIDYVVKEYGEGARAKNFFGKIAEGVYTLSGMMRAENVNRIVAIEVAKVSASRYMEILGTPGWEYGEYEKNEAARFLKDVLRFNPKDIENVESGKALKDKATYNKLLNKAVIWGHRSTQGGVDVLDLPKWMTRIGNPRKIGGMSINPGPFLVFQKIATSVTGNIVRNLVAPAVNYGNFSPLFRYAVGSNVSGEAQYALKKVLYPLDDPESIGTPINRVLMNLTKAEFTGMFSYAVDLMAPQVYDKWGLRMDPYINTGMGGAMRDLEPAVSRLLRNAYDELSSLKTFSPQSTLTIGQAVKNILKENIVLFSQADKVRKSQFQGEKSTDYINWKNTKNLGRQYQIAQGTYQNPVEQSSVTRNWYNHDLEDAMMFGEYNEKAKAYYDAFDYQFDKSKSTHPGFTLEARVKHAHESVMKSIKTNHPLNFSKNESGKFYSNLEHAEKWIKRQPNGMYKYRKHVVPAIQSFETNLTIMENIQRDLNLLKKYSSISEAFNIKYNPKR